jgi:hypothetical protein
VINTYAWARILDDEVTIAAMSDAEFAEFWAALGRAIRVSCTCHAEREPDSQ